MPLFDPCGRAGLQLNKETWDTTGEDSNVLALIEAIIGLTCVEDEFKSEMKMFNIVYSLVFPPFMVLNLNNQMH